MAVLQKETLHLADNGTRLTGLLMRPDGTAPLPGVVVIQEWWGIEPHVQDVAQRLAGEGFVVLVPDLYHGKVATEPDEAGKMMMALTGNMERAIQEIQLAVRTLQERADVEPKKISVMGFCMGGLLTWRAAEVTPGLAAIVPWYGAMYNPTEADARKLDMPILAIYGGQDGSIPPERRRHIDQLLKLTGRDAQILVYPEAGHAFLNNTHGSYNAAAARDAWPKAVAFLKAHSGATA